MIKNYYQILQVEKEASETDIKKAYRDLALKLHPDKNKSANAHEEFVELNEAFQILSDKSKRAKYDQLFDFYFGNGKKVVDEQVKEEFKSTQKQAREKGEIVANSNYAYFATEILAELVGTVLFNGIGTILDGTGEVIGEIFGNIDL